MPDKIKVTCDECGKEFEADEKLVNWMDSKVGKRTCPDCFQKGKAAKSGAAKSGSGTASKGKFGSPATDNKTSATSGKKPISADMFRKAFDELRAEFVDDYEEVKTFIGGWVSTLVINRSK
ncbi:MAG: hypothetical protein NC218_08095 [Acetobacter sp.]|nr:hypothetical protein [Acetobacter sp.]